MFLNIILIWIIGIVVDMFLIYLENKYLADFYRKGLIDALFEAVFFSWFSAVGIILKILFKFILKYIDIEKIDNTFKGL